MIPLALFNIPLSLAKVAEAISPDNIDYDAERKDLELNQAESDSFGKIMLDNGLVPLSSARGYDLGSGSFGSAFRASLNGKEVAVKITKESGDFQILQRILQIRDSASDDIKKHLPEIFLLKKDEKSGAYIIAMELLGPIPSDISEKLFYDPWSIQLSGDSLNSQLSAILRDEDAAWNLFRYEWESSSMDEELAPARLPSDFRSTVFKHIIDYIPLSANVSFINGLLDHMNAFAMKNIVGDSKEASDARHELELFVREFYRLIKRVVRGTGFPENANEADGGTRAIYRQIPESKGLLAALEFLEKNGIHWGDVHSGNIMARPSTGDLVAIDFGLYNLVE